MTTYREYPDVTQGSDEWNDLRRGMVTASAVGQLISVRNERADVFGCEDCNANPGDPCRSKVKRAGEYAPIKTFHAARVDLAALSLARVIEVAHDDTSRGLTTLLVAERITGYTDPTYVSDDMWRGITDEPIARDLYSRHHAPAREVGFMVREGDGWRLGYSPDGVVGDDGLIEIKSRRAKVHLRTILADEVPLECIAQCQAGLLVSGREWLDYVSYSGGMPLYVKRVFPSTKWFDAITAAVEQFEQTAAEMIRNYTEATKGLPATERIQQEMVI